MNIKAVVISLSVFSVVLVAVLALKFSAAEPDSNSNIPTPVLPTTERSVMSREELVAADWKIQPIQVYRDYWFRYGENEMKTELSTDVDSIRRGYLTDTIFVKKIATGEITSFLSDNFLPNKKLPFGFPDYMEAPLYIFTNEHLNKLYAFFGNHPSKIEGDWFLYESDLDGNNSKEIDLANGYDLESFRFSPDGTSLSYVLTRSRGQHSDVDSEFRVVNLINHTPAISFNVPGNFKQFVNNRRSQGIETIKDANWVAAWQFTNRDTLEFTRYFAEGCDACGYTQLTDKEVWSYNMKTGKLTLLETIPFTQVTSTSTNQIH